MSRVQLAAALCVAVHLGLLCGAVPLSEPASIGMLQLHADGGNEGDLSPAEVEKVTDETQKEIKQQIQKDEREEAEAEKNLGKPTAKEVALAKEEKVEAEAKKFTGARKAAAGEKQMEAAVEDVGPNAKKHLEKLETLVKKGSPNEDTLSSMETQGALLVKALLRPRHKEKIPTLDIGPEPSTRDLSSAKDKRKEERVKARMEEKKVKASKKEARKDEKFKAVLRAEKRDAETEYEYSKKQAEVAKAKAKGAESREDVIGKREVMGAKMAAKIQAVKAKLAKHMFDLSKTKLTAAQQASRAASSISKREQETLTDLKGQADKLKAKAKADKEKLDAARRIQSKEETQERRGKTLVADKALVDKNKAQAAEFKRVVARDKNRMMTALRKSKTGNADQVSKFEKFKAGLKINQRLSAARTKDAKDAQRKFFKHKIQFAEDDVTMSTGVKTDAEDKVRDDKKELRQVLNKVRDLTRTANETLGFAQQSGDKKVAESAKESLDEVKEAATQQQKYELRLADDKQALKSATKVLNMHKKALEKEKKLAQPKTGRTEKDMELEAMATEKAAAQISAESSTPERIIRTQAQVDVRKETREMKDQEQVVDDTGVKLKKAKEDVKAKSAAATQSSNKFMEILKSAKLGDAKKIKKASDKAAKALLQLDSEEETLNATETAHDEARMKLNSLKANVRTLTDQATKVLREKVKAKTIELQKKKDQEHELQLLNDKERSYEPKKYVEMAQVELSRCKDRLEKSTAMLSEAKTHLAKQKAILSKIPEGNAARGIVGKKIMLHQNDVNKWTERKKLETKELEDAKEMLESRRHLARVAIAVYRHQKGEDSGIIDEEMRKTKALFQDINKIRAADNETLMESINSDAQDIAQLAMTPGGEQKMHEIMNRAMKADAEGVALNKTMGFISRKLDEDGWTPTLKESENDGMTKDEFDAHQIAVQSIPVENGVYGEAAKLKLRHLMKQVSEDEDPGVPRRGISREELRVSERADKHSLRAARQSVARAGSLPHDVNDLDSIVNTLHQKPGMSREQFHAAMDAITNRRINLGIPESDKMDRAKAADRLAKIQSSWDKYQKQMKDVNGPDDGDSRGKDSEDSDREWQAFEMKNSHDAGRKHLEKTMDGFLPIVP